MAHQVLAKRPGFPAYWRTFLAMESRSWRLKTSNSLHPRTKNLSSRLSHPNITLKLHPGMLFLISDLGIYDRVVIQDLIKEMAQSKQIDPMARHKFKVVVFNEADTLSRSAQSALRRTMEKYMGNMRIILCCNATCKIISPIKSRCYMLRIPAPSVDQVFKFSFRFAMFWQNVPNHNPSQSLLN